MTIERREITDRELWLAWRREDVTASRVGALFHCHPYETALRLYAEKRGVEFETVENKAMRRGRWLEPAVGEAARELHPEWTVQAARCYLRDPELRLAASPDFFIEGDPRGLGVLQAKTVAPSVFHRQWDQGREVPFWIILQLATEVMLADAAFGAVAVLTVDPNDMDCIVLEIPRNPAAEAKIVIAVKQFWDAVAGGLEPEPDFSRDAEVIKALSPRSREGAICDLNGNNEVPIILAERAELKAKIKLAEARCEAIETELKFLMGDAETISGIPGWRVNHKTEHRKGYTVEPSHPRVLRIYDRRPQEAT
jgi:predicted phage-related endonuclease